VEFSADKSHHTKKNPQKTLTASPNTPALFPARAAGTTDVHLPLLTSPNQEFFPPPLSSPSRGGGFGGCRGEGGYGGAAPLAGLSVPKEALAQPTPSKTPTILRVGQPGAVRPQGWATPNNHSNPGTTPIYPSPSTSKPAVYSGSSPSRTIQPAASPKGTRRRADEPPRPPGLLPKANDPAQ